MFIWTKGVSTTMTTVDFERRLEGGRGCGNLRDGVVGLFFTVLY